MPYLPPATHPIFSVFRSRKVQKARAVQDIWAESCLEEMSDDNMSGGPGGSESSESNSDVNSGCDSELKSDGSETARGGGGGLRCWRGVGGGAVVGPGLLQQTWGTPCPCACEPHG